MASNSIGFSIILITLILGSTALIQSVGISINELAGSQSTQIEKSIEVKNQDLVVRTNTPNPNEFRLEIENTGSSSIDTEKFSILFENTDASIRQSFSFDGTTFNPSTVEISGDAVPENRTVIPSGSQLNVSYTATSSSRPSQVRVFTKSGVGDVS